MLIMATFLFAWNSSSSTTSTGRTRIFYHSSYRYYTYNPHSFQISRAHYLRAMAAPPTGHPQAANSLCLESITPDQLKLLSVTQTWNDKTMNRRKLSRQVQLLPPLFWLPAKPKATLGRLHDIPTEVIFATLDHTTIDALMNFRLTNSCAKYVVESWYPFREIMLSGASLVRAAIAIKASKFLTVSRLLAVTFGDRCELCGQLGSFVQLVKCMRCCFYCLMNDRRLHCVSLSFAAAYVPKIFTADSAVRILGLNVMKRNLERIPKVHTITQEFFWGHKRIERKSALDYTTALQFARPPIDPCYLPSILKERIIAGKARPYYFEMSPLIGRIDPAESNKLRFLTAIYQPGMLKKTSGLIVISDDGVFCRGCRFFWGLHSQGRHHLEHIMYSPSEIVLHLERCPYAKLTWNLVLKIISPNPLSERVPVPLEILVARAQHFRHRRSPNFGEMPWQFSIWFGREHLEQKQLTYGDSLIEETQANWAVTRPLGSSDMSGYTDLWRAWETTCKKRRIFFAHWHDL